jgi:hypothetical protein
MVSSRPLAQDNKHVNIIIKICVIKLGELNLKNPPKNPPKTPWY